MRLESGSEPQVGRLHNWAEAHSSQGGEGVSVGLVGGYFAQEETKQRTRRRLSFMDVNAEEEEPEAAGGPRLQQTNKCSCIKHQPLSLCSFEGSSSIF